MAVLLIDDFAGHALGAPGPADTGQTYALTGDPAQGLMTIVASVDTPSAHVFGMNPGGINGYAVIDCGGMPEAIATSFSFSAAGAELCLISQREEVFQGLNMGLHLLINPTYLQVQIRQTPPGGPAGEFENIGPQYVFADGPFGSPITSALPPDYPLGMTLSLAGDTLSIVLPDGVGIMRTDPRFATLMGSRIGLQSKRANASLGRGAWRSITVSGSIPAPALLPPIVFARGEVVTQVVTREDATVDLTTPVGSGDVVDCGAGHVLVVENASGVDSAVIVRVPVTYLGLSVADVVVPMPAAAGGVPTRRHIPLSPRRLFARGAENEHGGRAYVDYTVPAVLTRAVIK